MHRFPANLLDGYRIFMGDRYAREKARYRELAADGQKPTPREIRHFLAVLGGGT